MASSKLCPYHGMNATSDVGAERELAALGAGAVRDDLPGLHLLAHVHQRPLVDGGVLVGAPELLDAVAVVLLEARQRVVPSPSALVIAGVDDDLVGRHAGHDAAAAGDDHRARVARHLLLEPGAHQRRLREQQRHRLPLHVRAHQRAVGVVVLEERNQRRGDRDELLRRHVHEVDPVRRQQRVVVPLAAQHQLVGEPAVVA